MSQRFAGKIAQSQRNDMKAKIKVGDEMDKKSTEEF